MFVCGSEDEEEGFFSLTYRIYEILDFMGRYGYT